jgi:hypothetical protein
MSKLSLGPIAKAELVKLTISLSSGLKADLDRYASLHAETWETDALDTTTLIPHILETFLARDREFQRIRRQKGSK